jgi:hypothetical protein
VRAGGCRLQLFHPIEVEFELTDGVLLLDLPLRDLLFRLGDLRIEALQAGEDVGRRRQTLAFTVGRLVLEVPFLLFQTLEIRANRSDHCIDRQDRPGATRFYVARRRIELLQFFIRPLTRKARIPGGLFGFFLVFAFVLLGRRQFWRNDANDLALHVETRVTPVGGLRRD